MKTYTVTLENYEGRSKRVKVDAANEYDAMASAQKNGWFPVDVK
jgi:type II secretory pathway component PulF